MTVIETRSQLVRKDSPLPIERALLLGNPNVGKSALFFALTGRYATVSNYPGTTIEVTRGACRLDEDASVELVDMPGTTALAPLSEDERETCELLAAADPGGTAVVVVADARNLRRGLALALDAGSRGHRLALVVNMIDEARAAGLTLDAARLERLLDVPVVLTAATTGEGVEAVRRAILEARPLAYEGGDVWRDAASLRSAVVAEPTAGVDAPTLGARFAVGFGHAATDPVWGWPILLAVLAASYLVVGKLGAGVGVDFLQSTVFGAADGAGLNGILARGFAWLGAPALLQDLLFGPYGVVTMAFTYAIALILPIVGSFFVVFGFLEDTGYLPRLAVVTNRAFSTIGLNGKAVLPMVLGLGCDTMATLATRILPTRRERLLVALLLALAVPCSAQLAVIFGLFAIVGGPSLLAVWLAIVLAVLVVVGLLADRLLPGEPSDFIIELPPIRRPSAANIARKTLARIEWYLREAVPLFVLGTVLLFVLDRLHALEAVIRAAEPIVVGLLGLPRESATAFVLGFLRRDCGAVYLFAAARSGALTPGQVLTATVTLTLMLPCIASYFMLIREFGMKTAFAVAVFVLAVAIAAGTAVSLGVSP